MGVVFKQSVKGTIASLIGAGIGFVSTFFILTQVLTPEEIGLTRVLVEAAILIGGWALLGTQSSAIRYYPAFRTPDGSDRGFFKILLLIPLVGFAFFSLLYILFRSPLIEYFSRSDGSDSLFARYYLLVLPLMLFIMYQTLIEVYCSLRQRIFIPKALREVLLRILLLICYVVYGIWRFPFEQFMLLFVLVYGITSLFCLGYALRISPQSLKAPIMAIDKGVKRDFTHYTLFTLMSALGGSIISRLDIFMVSSQMGLNYSGIYTIAFFIVAVIEMPSRSLLSMTSPMVSQALYEGDIGETNRLFRKVSVQQLLVGTLFFLLIWINIDSIFRVIPHSEVYGQGKWVVFFLGLGRLVDLTFNLGNAVLRYSKYYAWTLAYTILVTLLTIVLNYFFIERLGMMGAAMATLITYVVSYAFQQVVLGIKLRIRVIHGETLWIIGTLAVVLLVHYFLPKLPLWWVDSLYRSLICGGLAVMILYRTESFQTILREVKSVIHK